MLTTTLVSAFLLSGCAAETPPGATPAPITLRGTWILSPEGKPYPPSDFKRGLQTSGLALRKGELWSLGDQRSEFPGALFRIDPKTGRLIQKPIPLDLPPKAEGESAEWTDLRSIPRGNPDYEGLCGVPSDPGRMIAITEDKTPWVVDIRIEASTVGYKARITSLTRVLFPAGLEPWRDDPNFRLEGCAVNDDSKTLYLAFERAKDDLPRIYRAPLEAACSGKPLLIEEIPLPFAKIPRRADKEKARLNVNDLQFFRFEGRAALLAVLRDQERLCVIDLEKKEIPRVLDLNLLDPTGEPIEWVSPEGVAIDPASGKIWIVNDPDSVGTNYRARKAAAPEGEYANYTSLLFEIGGSPLLKP